MGICQNNKHNNNNNNLILNNNNTLFNNRNSKLLKSKNNIVLEGVSSYTQSDNKCCSISIINNNSNKYPCFYPFCNTTEEGITVQNILINNIKTATKNIKPACINYKNKPLDIIKENDDCISESCIHTENNSSGFKKAGGLLSSNNKNYSTNIDRSNKANESNLDFNSPISSKTVENSFNIFVKFDNIKNLINDYNEFNTIDKTNIDDNNLINLIAKDKTNNIQSNNFKNINKEKVVKYSADLRLKNNNKSKKQQLNYSSSIINEKKDKLKDWKNIDLFKYFDNNLLLSTNNEGNILNKFVFN